MTKSVFGVVSAAHRKAVAKAAEYEAWKELADELKRVGSFEKLAAEAEAKKAQAEADLAAVGKKIEAAQADFEGARKNAEHQREANANAEADHRDALERIRAEGVEAGKRAAAEANKIIEDARTEAAADIAAMERQKDRLNDELASVRAEIVTASAELAEVLKQKEDALSSLGPLKDKIVSLFGGRV